MLSRIPDSLPSSSQEEVPRKWCDKTKGNIWHSPVGARVEDRILRPTREGNLPAELGQHCSTVPVGP